jgi:hypothetical protein
LRLWKLLAEGKSPTLIARTLGIARPACGLGCTRLGERAPAAAGLGCFSAGRAPLARQRGFLSG